MIVNDGICANSCLPTQVVLSLDLNWVVVPFVPLYVFGIKNWLSIKSDHYLQLALETRDLVSWLLACIVILHSLKPCRSFCVALPV